MCIRWVKRGETDPFLESSVWEIGVAGRKRCRVRKRSWRAEKVTSSAQAASESARRDKPNCSAARVPTGSSQRPQNAVRKDAASSARPPCLPPPPGTGGPCPAGCLCPSAAGGEGGTRAPRESEIIGGGCQTAVKGAEGIRAETQKEAEGVSRQEQTDGSSALKPCRSQRLLCTPSARQREILPRCRALQAAGFRGAVLGTLLHLTRLREAPLSCAATKRGAGGGGGGEPGGSCLWPCPMPLSPKEEGLNRLARLRGPC